MNHYALHDIIHACLWYIQPHAFIQLNPLQHHQYSFYPQLGFLGQLHSNQTLLSPWHLVEKLTKTWLTVRKDFGDTISAFHGSTSGHVNKGFSLESCNKTVVRGYILRLCGQGKKCVYFCVCRFIWWRRELDFNCYPFQRAGWRTVFHGKQ